MRHQLSLALTLSLSAALGCTAVPPSHDGRPAAPPAAKASRPPNATPVGGPGGAAWGPTRRVGPEAVAVSLTGKVKLLADQGTATISNTTGELLSKVRLAANGGDLLSKVRYGVRAAGAPEAPLADAVVEFLDGDGQLLVDAAGVPLSAPTDDAGAYRFEGRLPAEALVARVRLWHGGVLLALMPAAAPAARALDLDTASTLGASWVLERLVGGRKAILGRLAGDDAEALRRELEAARGGLGPTPPSYRPADLAGAAEALGRQDPAVAGRLAHVKAVLLAGQEGLGEGLAAARVSLGGPIGIVGDAAGTLFVVEYLGGRVRRIGPDGTVHRFLGGDPLGTRVDGPAGEIALQGPTAAVAAPDGTLYVADGLGDRVVAIAGDRARVVVGTGERAQRALGQRGVETPLMGPNALALGPDGRLWIGEHTKRVATPGRLLAIGPDGTVSGEAAPVAPGLQITGLAFTGDGAQWLLGLTGPSAVLWRRPAGGDWVEVAHDLAANDGSRLAALPDGGVAVAEQDAGRVVRVAPDGRVTVLAGGVEARDGGEGGPAKHAGLVAPTGLWLDGSGVLYVSDMGAGLVRAIAPPLDGTGPIRTVAGTRGVSQLGDALAIALNSPGGMTLDPAGRLVFSETGAHVVKRLDGGALTLVAGTTRGFGGDGGPAGGARLDAPTGVAFRGDALHVLDVENHRIRRIGPDGVITTVVGDGGRGELPAGRSPGLAVRLRRPVACAVAPDGRLYWVDNENAQIGRLNADGSVELIVGRAHAEGDTGDGGPALEARLNRPTGLAFDAGGRLYVADTGNGRLRRITGLEGDAPRMEAFAGAPLAEALARLGEPEPAGPRPVRDAVLVGITALAFGGQDDLYLAEVGTARLATLLGDSPAAALLRSLPTRGARILRVTGLTGGQPVVAPIAGAGTGVLDAPGTDGALLSPLGLVLDPARGLFVMDTGNNTLRLVPRAALPATAH